MVAGVYAVFAVGAEFLDGTIGIGRVIHEAEVFPYEFLAGSEIEAEEIWINCETGGFAAEVSGRSVAATAVQSKRVFVAIRDAQPGEGVGNYDFGFRANPFAAGGVVFRGIWLE